MANTHYTRPNSASKRTRKICGEPGCSFKIIREGKCERHSPSSVHIFTRPPRGELSHWIAQHKSYVGDDCLPWPFGMLSNGYGACKRTVASRVMCAAAHGPPPFKGAEAAHSCGNGKEGCVNPNHLRWATSLENKADSIRHERTPRGTRSGHAKINDEQALAIFLDPRRQQAIAKEFGISRGAVTAIKSGTNWGWLTSGHTRGGSVCGRRN